jgi:quinol monooxygenase YgiN
MAALIVRHRVANFEAWKKIFDEMEATRRQHGWIGHDLYRDANDPNLVTVVNHVRDLAGAKDYGMSPALREAMQRGGVLGAPDVTFLDDSEQRKY